MRRMFLHVVFTRWAEAGPRLFQAPVISGGAKSAARTGGGGRGRVIFGKSLSCLPLSRAESQVGVEPPFGTLRVATVGGPRPYPVIHTEAALLAWLDERTELGFEVASDQLASWCGVWEVSFFVLLCRGPSGSRSRYFMKCFPVGDPLPCPS